MIRSLFAGVAGMKNHQIRMDVIANNISNVNTVGFKSGRANFQDVLYQTLKSAGTSTNPAQVGLGVSLAGISNNMNPGGLQSTGRTLDLAINGDGFFKVIDPGSGKEYYTRDGVFYIDQNGYVVNSSGYRLVGEARNITSAWTNEINVDGTVTINGKLTLQGTRADGTDGESVEFTFDNIKINELKDLDALITKINAESYRSGVEVSRKTITDNTGTHHYLVFRTSSNSDTAKLTISSSNNTNPLTFNNNNSIGDVTIYGTDVTTDNSHHPFTDYIRMLNGPAASLNVSKDGLITGTDKDGNILEWKGDPSLLKNNPPVNADLLQITLYTFSNQDGLQRAAQNLFSVSKSSGPPNMGKPGSAGYGTVESGYLEMSNVDLTDEFTNMITTQRGYQASARIITVSDTMLDELINLKR
ncbi:flagellar hook-basal body complex protein [Desulfofundulus thermobenzoicus]|uniref:Flagellar hook protein FlgE n=1 Tax=Desulfofundulus thermobenzoicus TaxID=29376 RepID=A0A6N7IN65_9FIRM|nr:flagellar hook-basal body complex protein [Desulfofundulus thermobenzoicus]MQL51426.1 flagellar hook-basal body complex protein [Desulfofundulus thermobenzoicus]